MGVLVYLDVILIPLSMSIIAVYHAYLWHCFKNKPCLTTFGNHSLRRKVWFLCMNEDDDKKSMLAVQSLRNAKMGTIFTASIAILVNLAVAALTNNAYKASHLLHGAFSESESGGLYALKFGSASLFLLTSFLCSSMGLGFMVDANFLLNTSDCEHTSPEYTQKVSEQGFVLAHIGNRVLFISFPLLTWLFGPVPLALTSLALIWVLYQLDFCGNNVFCPYQLNQFHANQNVE